MNHADQVRFADGTLVPQAESVTYLGSAISKNVNSNLEVNKRIAAALQVKRKLDLFWKQARCSCKLKLLAYNSIVITKLTYGLETIQLTSGQLNRLDAFQIKGFRQILWLKHPYFDRTNTNAKVMQIAKQLCGKEQAKVSEIIQTKRIQLLGSILRAPADDPIKQAALKRNTLCYVDSRHRCVGRPRKKWVEESFRAAWERLQRCDPTQLSYKGSTQQKRTLEQYASFWQAPFQTHR